MKLLKNPVISELAGGVVVVDFGAKWFRCSPDGSIITKIAEGGKVVTRLATSGERVTALAHAAFDPAT